MRPHDRIHELPATITLGRRPSAETPPAPVRVSFVPEPPVHDGLHFSFPMRDSMNPLLLPTREELVHFLESVHPMSSRHASYWYCHAGQNRSAFGLAAYLHLFRGLAISDGIELLRARRDVRVLCNPLFETTLRSWFGTSAEQTFLSPTVESLQRRWGLQAIPTLDDEPIPLGEAAPLGPGDGGVFEVLDFGAA